MLLKKYTYESIRRPYRCWDLKQEPRSWQSKALSKWSSDFTGIASVATGAGKTIFAFMCMQEASRQIDDLVVVIVVPTLALLDQWHVSLVEDLDVDESEISVYSGIEKSDSVSKVNIVVLNTARKIVPEISNSNSVMLIVDECHRAASPQNALALRGDHAATLGLSATPERQYDDGFEKYLVPSLGPVIASYDYVDATSDGVISPFNLVNVEIQLTPAEVDRYSKLTKSIAKEMSGEDGTDSKNHPNPNLENLLRIRAGVASNAAARVPVAAAIAFKHRSERTIIFHERIAAAEDIVKILNQRGFSAALYHSKMFGPLRRDNLRMFRRGMIETLVTCRALDEGLNVPEATVAIVAASTSSRRQRIQRLGRVLRPSPGKSVALVYTLYATEPERERLILESQDLVGTAKIVWQEGRVGDADSSG